MHAHLQLRQDVIAGADHILRKIDLGPRQVCHVLGPEPLGRAEHQVADRFFVLQPGRLRLLPAYHSAAVGQRRAHCRGEAEEAHRLAVAHAGMLRPLPEIDDAALRRRSRPSPARPPDRVRGRPTAHSPPPRPAAARSILRIVKHVAVHQHHRVAAAAGGPRQPPERPGCLRGKRGLKTKLPHSARGDKPIHRGAQHGLAHRSRPRSPPWPRRTRRHAPRSDAVASRVLPTELQHQTLGAGSPCSKPPPHPSGEQ